MNIASLHCSFPTSSPMPSSMDPEMKVTDFSTARLHLRPLRQSDDAVLFPFMSDPEVMRYWDWPEHDSPTITTAYVAVLLEEVAAGKAHYWAICLGPEGHVIGTCDLSEIDEHHRRAEVGFMVAREYWGKGYAFEAMQAVVEYAVRSMGIERFSARTHAGNERSAVLLRRLGFVLEGTLRGYVKRDGIRCDCWLFGCVK
jgi:[ribosomal protein S5]-alanine N-acetyltransferase